MHGWTDTILGDVLTLQRGFDLAERLRVPGGVPIVSSSGVSGYHSVAKVKAPGVVTGRYGTLGEVFYVDEDFWPLNTTLWVKDFKGNYPRFVSFLLQTLNLAHQNAAGAVPGVNRNALHLLPVRVPPRAIQERIASILSAYDDLIENNTRRIKILEEMAQMIYREWFVHFRFPGHEKVRMCESELGPIPKSWRIVELGNVIDFQNGKAASSITDGALPLYGSNGVIGRASVPRYEDAVIIGRVGAYCGSIMYCRTPFWASDNTIVAKPLSEDSLCVEVVYHLLRTMNLRRYAGGSAQPLLTQTVLRRLTTILPDEGTNKKIRDMLRPINGLIIALNSKNGNLRTTRDLLLPRLISGEIPVEAAEETADELVAQPA